MWTEIHWIVWAAGSGLQGLFAIGVLIASLPPRLRTRVADGYAGGMFIATGVATFPALLTDTDNQHYGVLVILLVPLAIGLLHRHSTTVARVVLYGLIALAVTYASLALSVFSFFACFWVLFHLVGWEGRIG